MKTVLITGASSGIGLAISKKLLTEGHTVIGMARNFDKSALTHDHFHKVIVDFSDLETLPDKLRQVVNDFPIIDTVVCCAGKGQFGSLEEFSYQQMQSLMELNFLSQAYVSKAVLPVMKKIGKGDVIFIGSEAALNGSRKGTIYCASKFALRGFAQALRDECSKSSIRVTIINPGMVKTGFFNELDFEPGDDEANFIEADDVAHTVSMVMSARIGTVFDEINLSPQKKVVRFGKQAQETPTFASE